VFFGDHPLAYRVLGTRDTVGPMTLDAMRAYFGLHYGPGNVIVAGAGKIDFERFVDDVGKIAGSWPAAQSQRDYRAPSFERREKTIVDPKLTRQYLAMMCPGPSAQDERRYAAKVLTDVLGDAEGSRLYWALIDPGLAEEATFSFEPQDRAGAFLAFATCDPERSPQVEKTLLDTLDNYAASIDDGEIERAKNKLATALTLHGEQPAGRMQSLGGTWAYLGKYLPLEEELERLTVVTAADVKALLAEMPFEPKTIVRLGPG
jgi:predicted Zn-dependent peptidase